MRTALYVLLALAVPAFAGQTVYKWVDEKGVTHYSDQPGPGAQKIELSSGTSRVVSPPPSYTPAPAAQPRESVTSPAYQRFVVESPQQDEAIINTGGAVRVRLAATPAISLGHIVTLYLDGVPVQDFPPQAMEHEFANMPRGTHTVRAVVSTRQGKTIQETPVVTFHVRQESAAQPPVGPNLRNNKPKRTAGNKLRTDQPSYAALNGSKPVIDPRTNRPVITKKPPAGPKANPLPKSKPKDAVNRPGTGK